MDERFPNANPDELNSSDASCIICREEMVIAKKLLCGHLFHVHCLRYWLERQNTCPTCRASVIPTENGPAGSSLQARSTVPTPSTQGAEDGAVKLSQHQLRLRAASLAASLYEKSNVCSPVNTYFGSPGYSFPNHRNILETNASSSQISGPSGAGSLEQQQQLLFSGGYPHITMPSQLPGSSSNSQSAGVSSAPKVSLLACETFLQSQIKMLESELQALRKQNEDRTISDIKGKSVVNSA